MAVKATRGCYSKHKQLRCNKNVNVLGLAEGCAIDDNLFLLINAPTRSISVGCDDGAFRVPKEYEFTRLRELRHVFARRCARAASGMGIVPLN